MKENYREQCQRWGNMPNFHRQPSLPFSLLEVRMTGASKQLKRRKLCECVCLSLSDFHPSRGSICLQNPSLVSGC